MSHPQTNVPETRSGLHTDVLEPVKAHRKATTSKIADKASESTYQKSYQQKLLDKINHDVEQMNMSLDSIPDDDDEYGI